MKSYFIVINSMTLANKAKLYLQNMNIRCQIERNKSLTSGCGFGIRVYDDPYEICEILRRINVPCVKIAEM